MRFLQCENRIPAIEKLFSCFKNASIHVDKWEVFSLNHTNAPVQASICVQIKICACNVLQLGLKGETQLFA